MTGKATWVNGGAFLKRYSSQEAAETAFKRSIVAQAAGVPTPAVLGQSGPMVLSFERIAAQGKPLLGEMVQVVSLLHRMPPRGLARFDPFLRINSRLSAAPPPVGLLVDALQRQDAALCWSGVSAIHGDFHPGQTVRDSLGKVWLIDLDDMALAPPEADLGNLAAWLATQTTGELGALEADALAQVLPLAPDADPILVAHFCAIALVRRALKLAERGQCWVIGQLPLRA